VSKQIDLGKIGFAGALSAAKGWAAPSRGNFPREEVEAAYREYVRRANINDWDLWAGMFTEECLYVDHHFGTFTRRIDVRNWMTPLMATQPEMCFIPEFYAIQGDLVVNYNWNRWPNPDGSFEPYNDPDSGIANINYRYQFPCVTLNRYAGDGLFWYEEDLYSPSAYMEIITQWKADMGRHGRKYGQ
jgi:hypothetical protein